MIEYYKSIGILKFIYKGKIQYICKISDNKVYFYDSITKHWILSLYLAPQYVLKWYDPIPLTLLDIIMLGVPE